MKTNILTCICLFFFLTEIIAQDIGKITITNAAKNYPNFIVSLNGVRLQNDYTGSSSFKFVDETSYRVKILQAGSSSVLNFTISSEPKYHSNYLIMKDQVGNYSMVLQSKSLMLNDPENEQSVPTPAAVAATPSLTKTIAPTPSATTATLVQGPVAMNDAVYKKKLNEVKAKSFDDDRLEHIRNAFEYESFNTGQVVGLMKVFTFDDKRLEVAKFAYPKTIDKEEFYKTYDQFSFSSSKTSLKEWIANYKRK